MVNQLTARSIAFCSCIVLCSSVRAEELITFAGRTMGTRYAVTITPRDDAKALEQQIAARLTEINRLMSTYDEASELSRFNQYDRDDWFDVSDDTATVVQFALNVAEETAGAFDPTVGPAVNLWGFGPAGRREQPPGAPEIARVLARIGYRHLEVRRDPPALRKQRADVYLDLSGVAKGYAVDEITDILTRAGCRESLVVIGGEIRATGRKPNGSYWRIGVETPDTLGKVPKDRLQIENAAVGTSGDWRNAFVHDGVRYSHVIDPRTARPAKHTVASVTVVADTATQTDAWATALLVMGDERGIAWCEERGVGAMFFVRRPDGHIVARRTSHLAKRVISQ